MIKCDLNALDRKYKRKSRLDWKYSRQLQSREPTEVPQSMRLAGRGVGNFLLKYKTTTPTRCMIEHPYYDLYLHIINILHVSVFTQKNTKHLLQSVKKCDCF